MRHFALSFSRIDYTFFRQINQLSVEEIIMTRHYDRQTTSGQLVSYLPNSYAERTSRPIYALVFLLGFMVAFICGTFFIQPATLSETMAEPQVRVVAFVWVQNMMEFLGFSTRAAIMCTPLVVVVILLALQVTSQRPWKINYPDLALMMGECLLLSVPLIVLSLLLNRAVPANTAALTAATVQPQNILLVDIITGIGAGIFEELIFRLILICFLMLVFQDLFGLEKKPSVVLSVVISAILFSTHHHIFFANGHFYQGDTFTFGKFIFRALAGGYFAALYAVRGFGITAGTHACYNILAAIARTLLFMIRPE